MCLMLSPRQQQKSGLKPAIYSEGTPPRSNIMKEEARNLKKLREDQSRIIVNVDKYTYVNMYKYELAIYTNIQHDLIQKPPGKLF